MTINRANFADVLAPGFRQIFVDALKWGEKPPVATQVFNMLKAPKAQYVDDSYVSGFGLIPTKDEGSAVSYDDLYQGFDKRYTFDTYSMAYRITQEMWEDDRYGVMKKMPDALGRSMRATIETDAANMFNNGFATTGTDATGPDGLELFSTVHLLSGGGTQKNELTTAADLSETTLEQAFIDIWDTTDDRGIMLNLEPSKLLIPNELAWDAEKLLKTKTGYGVAHGDINPASNTGLTPVVWHYLTDTDAWFIICTEHEANWFWRVSPDHYQGNDFDTDDAKFKVRARWKRGWSAPWGLFGSPGA